MLKHTVWILPLLASLPTSVEAHFLWKIETETPSFLYGTVHSSDSTVSDLPPEVSTSLRRSSTFHPELEFSPQNIGLLTAAIFASGTRNLQEELSPKLWERTLRNARRLGFPAPMLRQVPVQLAPLLFSSPPEADFERIVDIQVYRQAIEHGLAFHALETVEEQVGVFRSLSREAATTMLEESLDEFEQGFPSQDKILRLYREGDIEALFSFVQEELSRTGLPEFAEKLLDRRNDRMVERLLPFVEKGGAFVAVGVAHMPGESGIIEQLERKGYRISRIEL